MAAKTHRRWTRWTHRSWTGWEARAGQGARAIAVIALGIGVAGALTRAAGNRKFYETRAAMQRDFAAEQQQLGLAGTANRKALYTQYPTPEITLCKPVVVAPGASAPITVTGKFPDKTKFLAANDDVELTGGTLVSGTFTATATVAATAPASFAPVYAIAPVSGANRACPAVFVGLVSAYELKADNGWTVKVTPSAKTFTFRDGHAVLPYDVAFFERAEAMPFRTMSSALSIREHDEPGTQVYLSLTAVPAAGSVEAELQAIQNRMRDTEAYMKLPQKEQQRLSARMIELTEQHMQAIADPNYTQALQADQDAFGCSALMFRVTNGTIAGRATCGKNVGASGQLTLSGTMTGAP